MNLIQFAQQIDGLQLQQWLTDVSMNNQAKELGIVICYISIDDGEQMINLEGELEESFDSYAGPDWDYDETYVSLDGKLLVDEELSTLRHHLNNFKYYPFETYYKLDENGKVNATFQIELSNNIKYEKFTILRGQELYCIGIVFNQIKQQQLNLSTKSIFINTISW
ncbi:hypothetical protein [Emticicia sp. BO119]|uniref:hypothetical protein n=1 Tax=Emticicia sp. BO119 TaxID=2757768 RepID=UPI0015F09E0A|nr:hypothetical protein [Emticicia sp. BO119]MBA4849002.1 hypothetical protein [Emticicia sp. BO119]